MPTRRMGRRRRSLGARCTRRWMRTPSSARVPARVTERRTPTDRAFDASGRILRDNIYGTIDEDVWRRDFTANALYYNIADFSIWDYVGGAADIAARTLRLIGDPETRYREDPVRMLRAARFEAKLGFTIDPATAAPIDAAARTCWRSVPPARLFDETLKLFLTGHGARSFEVLRRRGLLAALLPSVDAYLAQPSGQPGREAAGAGPEEHRCARAGGQAGDADLPVRAPACMGRSPASSRRRRRSAGTSSRTILDACDRAMREAQTRISIPKRFSLGVREMFALQPRLEHPRGRRALRVLEHPRFRAAYDLLLLRAQFGLAPQEMAQWWTRLQEVSAEERGRMADALAGATRARRRRRRRAARPPPPAPAPSPVRA